MRELLASFILTSMAGLSTIIGYFIIFIRSDKDKVISFALSFASGIMLTISVIDLIPSSNNYLNNYHFIFRILLMIFFFILGIFISTYLSKKVESNDYDSLKKVGIISMLAIIFHNIPEGIITFMVSGVNFTLGIKLAIAISLHNIPEGISIAVPYYYATRKKMKTFLLVLISGLSELLGAIICYVFLRNIINNFMIGCIFSLIAGIMINISLIELLPESFKYKSLKISYLGFITGCITMIISHIII